MNLIEKKCPNCGADLEFNENDKSCKCEYCKRNFEIERENNSSDKSSADNYNLNELKGSNKIISTIIFIIAFIGIIFIGYRVYQMDSNFSKANYYTNATELTDDNLEDFDANAYEILEKQQDGLNEYELNLNVDRQATYVLYNKKDNKNLIIPVYKATYKKPLDTENIYTIYVPITYENIKNELILELNGGKIEAPEYYFNMEHSEYAYGYQSLDDVYNNYIKTFENDYKITKK